MNKSLIALVVFFIAVNVSAAPVADNCAVSGVGSAAGDANTALVECISATPENSAEPEKAFSTPVAEHEALNNFGVKESKGSLAESVIVVLFIPALILLWFSRFTKSTK